MINTLAIPTKHGAPALIFNFDMDKLTSILPSEDGCCTLHYDGKDIEVAQDLPSVMNTLMVPALEKLVGNLQSSIMSTLDCIQRQGAHTGRLEFFIHDVMGSSDECANAAMLVASWALRKITLGEKITAHFYVDCHFFEYDCEFRVPWAVPYLINFTYTIEDPTTTCDYKLIINKAVKKAITDKIKELGKGVYLQHSVLGSYYDLNIGKHSVPIKAYVDFTDVEYLLNPITAKLAKSIFGYDKDMYVSPNLPDLEVWYTKAVEQVEQESAHAAKLAFNTNQLTWLPSLPAPKG